jgi:NAD(P)-dependent dehydrogenase (short-subunit alcohol dehydrogenase family)
MNTVQLFNLAEKVAIVTGSTKGIGRGIADCLATCGAQVVVSSRSQQDCDRVATELNEIYPGTSCYGMRCEISDAASISTLVDAVVQRSGGIDVLVCNAARMPRLVPFGETADDEFLAQFDTNVVKTLRLCLQAAASMKGRGGGSIVLIGSRTGLIPAPQQSAYSCAKAAETHLARNLAVHLAADNIRVNCIAPGLIRSESSNVVFDNPAAMNAFARDIPLHRGGESREIGGGVVFLASAAGAYVTGVTIPIDGGVVGLPPSPGVSSPTFDLTREPAAKGGFQ